ncbi:MAG TPA: CBS domain-containing protein [Thermoanaerobaculia bacterium]|nr:CBS domain-containing protein [Thermoanaerobaculia bacterium]
MKVEEVMSRELRACAPEDDLGRAAIEMWRGDCGMLPVVWAGRVVGVVTDRDICMGLALKGCAPAERRVREVMSGEVYSCVPEDDLGDALELMASRRVRRLPVLEGDRLVGVLSMNDVLLNAEHRGHPPAREILAALRAICTPRHELPSAAPAPAGRPAAA